MSDFYYKMSLGQNKTIMTFVEQLDFLDLEISRYLKAKNYRKLIKASELKQMTLDFIVAEHKIQELVSLRKMIENS